MAAPHNAPSTAGGSILNPKNVNTRTVVPAAIITIALVSAFLLVIFWAPTAEAAPTKVYMESDNGRLVMTLAGLEVGEARQQEDGGTTTEQIAWSRLQPEPGPLDTRDGAVLLGQGSARGDSYTEVRLVFEGVQIARDGVLHDLVVPQDTLHIRLPEPGQAGDALLVALDAEQSISEENGYLTFRPRIVESLWERDGAGKDTAPLRTTPSSSDRDNASVPAPRAPTTVESSSRTPQTPTQPPMGRLAVGFIGNGTGIVQSLDVTVSKIALAEETNPDDPLTRYENKASAQLVRSAQEGAAPLPLLQVKPGTYSSLHFEFSNASANLLGAHEREAAIPQPQLALERPLEIKAGQTLAIIVVFGVEDSLRFGVEGLEFRPVIHDYLMQDAEGRDITDPFPAQYRTGGSWLPSLGERTNDTLRDHELDPESIPHPINGDRDRDLRSEGSISDVDRDTLEDLLNGTRDSLTGDDENGGLLGG